MRLDLGFFRLWLVVTIFWAAWCGYQSFENHEIWANEFALAKSESIEMDAKRDRMIEKIVVDAKAEHEVEKRTTSIHVPLDEGKLRDDAFSFVTQKLRLSAERRELDNRFQKAFAAKSRRDDYLVWLVMLPIGMALLLGGGLWVIKGFKKQA
jgi:hypothetical protein